MIKMYFIIILGFFFGPRIILSQITEFEIPKSDILHFQRHIIKSNKEEIIIAPVNLEKNTFFLLEFNKKTQQTKKRKFFITKTNYKNLEKNRCNFIVTFEKVKNNYYLVLGNRIMKFVEKGNKFHLLEQIRTRYLYTEIFATDSNLIFCSIYPNLNFSSSIVLKTSMNLDRIDSLTNYCQIPEIGHFNFVRLHSVFENKITIFDFIKPQGVTYNLSNFNLLDTIKLEIDNFKPMHLDTVVKMQENKIKYNPMTFIDPFSEYYTKHSIVTKSFVKEGKIDLIIGEPNIYESWLYRFSLENGEYKLQEKVSLVETVKRTTKSQKSDMMLFDAEENCFWLTEISNENKKWRIKLYKALL